MDGEFLRIALHRYLLMFYALIVAFIFIANANPARDAVPLAIRLTGYGTSVLVGVGVLFLSVAASRRITLRRTGTEVIPFPVNLALTVICAVLFGEAATPLLYGEPMAQAWQILLKLVFYVVIVEVAAAVMLYALLPRIVSQMRGRTYRTLLDLMGQELMGLADAGGTAPVLRLAGHDVPPASLIRLEVDGDMVRIITTDGTRIAQGPLAQLVEPLPPALGIMVHRADWVARHAVVATTRIGRSRGLRLRNGDVVRVASSRDEEVAEWLRRHGIA